MLYKFFYEGPISSRGIIIEIVAQSYEDALSDLRREVVNPGYYICLNKKGKAI